MIRCTGYLLAAALQVRRFAPPEFRPSPSSLENSRRTGPSVSHRSPHIQPREENLQIDSGLPTRAEQRLTPRIANGESGEHEWSQAPSAHSGAFCSPPASAD